MKKENIYELKFMGDIYNLKIRKGTYRMYKGLALEAYDADSNEPFCSITVNLMPHATIDDPTCQAYIDVNNCPEFIKMIKKYKLAKDTGVKFTSGFVTYPLYEFKKEFLDELRRI